MGQDFSAYRNKPHLPLPLLSEKWTGSEVGIVSPPHLLPSDPFWNSCSTSTLVFRVSPSLFLHEWVSYIKKYSRWAEVTSFLFCMKELWRQHKGANTWQ
jgi:hypothetical protein